MNRLVLASASASRKNLLAAAGVAFDAIPADLDEAALMASMAGAPASEVAVALAEAKALAVARAQPGRLVLGGDSVLAFDGLLLSKSPDLAAARHVLQQLSGRTHRIFSGAALARDGQIVWRHTGEGALTMRALGAAFLDRYLEHEGPAILGSVGCYHLEGRGAQLFNRVEGDYFSILGLPLLPVLAALRNQGILEP